MGMREKLIALLGEDVCKSDCCGDCECQGNEDMCIATLKAYMADHLIANGVTIPVRCKECHNCTKSMWCNLLMMDVEANNFCSYGERRTDGN